jgi:transposase
VAQDPRDERIAELEAEVATLKAALAKALARIAELEERVRSNSTNSSKPPSSDPPSMKRAIPKPKGRKPGGQPGHSGHQRKLLPLEEISALVELKPATCRRCGHSLQGKDPEPWRHQVTEIPQVKPTVTEYRRHLLVCPHCGETTRAQLPNGVTESPFGPRLTTTIATCTGIYQLSRRTTEGLLQDQYGVELSLGSVSACEERASQALATPVARAVEYAQTQAAANVDETGWRLARKLAWLWVMVTPLVTVFRVQVGRGLAEARELLGQFKGILSSDRWKAYDRWGGRRQLCWAHLLRDFICFSERGEASETLGLALIEETKRLLRKWWRMKDGELTREQFRQRVRPIQRRIEALLQKASDCRQEKTAGQAKEMLKLRHAFWTFIELEGVEPTNNAAERALRAAVLWRKRSFGSHSQEGAAFAERMLTCAATLRSQRRNVIDFITRCVESHWRNLSPPSLLAA